MNIYIYIYVYIYIIYIYIHIYLYSYIHTLVTFSPKIVIFERCIILRQYQSIHFDLLRSSIRRLFAMVNEFSHIVKDCKV